MRKYVIDTNVILHTADSLVSFPDGEVVIPLDVLEELDAFKKFNDEKGRIARRVSRFLDELRSVGHLANGISLENGGRLSVCTTRTAPSEAGLDPAKKDNHILWVAWSLMKNGEDVVFVSKDINSRIKADVVGVPARDFEKQKVSFDEFNPGWVEYKVPIAKVEKPIEAARELTAKETLTPNQFVLLRNEDDDSHYSIVRVDPESGVLVHLLPEADEAYSIRARNPHQRMALELLLDKRVQLVTLIGQAGTGKTLLALAAAMKQAITTPNGYDRVVVARPVVPVGKDLGYLPGTKEEKIAAWMDPIFDNLEYILGLKSNRKQGYTVDRLLEEEILQLEALTYIRGRSMPNQYLIVDECQNLTPLEVKTIISRAGEGTKVVLTGDPYQIDNPYLDVASNGLVYTADRMRQVPLHGHISLVKSERSQLASLAAELL